MRRALHSLIWLTLFMIGLAGPAAAKRVALVIGNDDYAKVAKLQMAVNDAKAIGEALEGKAAPSRTFKPGEEIQECDQCPKMVVLPAGQFMMGSPESEKGRYDVEGPRHKVTIPASFAVGKFEITFGEWDACVDNGGCEGHRPDDKGWGRGKRPVINVNWDEAKAYVAWLARKTGKDYRLLSESEWEYAARAGTTTSFSTGRRITTDQANFNGDLTHNGSRKGRSREKTISVGSFGENAFGLHDMLGNVWEWVEDCWNESYSGAPSDGLSRTSSDCSRRVLRGGAWGVAPWDLRSAVRSRVGTGNRSGSIGFRVARTLAPKELVR